MTQQDKLGLRLRPLLKALSKLLNAQADLIERIRLDLLRALKKPGKPHRNAANRMFSRSRDGTKCDLR
jgi:hypothetical protein